MQKYLGALSIAALVMVSLTGCWRKKCCKHIPEEACTELVEQTICRTSPEQEDLEDEFPIPGHVQERVSGPSHWAKDNLK
jgi:hypothetical protein